MIVNSVVMVIWYILFERAQNRADLNLKKGYYIESTYTFDDFGLLDQGHAILGERLCICVDRKGE